MMSAEPDNEHNRGFPSEHADTADRRVAGSADSPHPASVLRSVDAVFAATGSERFERGTLTDAAEVVALAACDVVGADRASIWIFRDDRTALQCLGSHERSSCRHSCVNSVSVRDCEAWLTEMNSRRILMIADAQADPRTTDWVRINPVSPQISSIIHAGIVVSGCLEGVLCCDFLSTCREWRDADGVLVAMLADKMAMAQVQRDAARAIDACRTAIDRNERILDAAADGVFTCASDGRIRYANQALAVLLGLACAGDLMRCGTNITTFTREDAEDDGEFLALLQQGGELREYRCRWQRADNSPVDVVVCAACIPDPVGSDWCIRGVVQDAGRRLHAEELVVAKEAAEAANEAKSRFLASMSHEIRTPLNAILGMADLLSESNLDDKQSRYVTLFQNAGQNLLDLINDILDLSKVEAGQLELENTTFDLEDVVERTCEIVALKAHEKGIELLCQFDEACAKTLVGDPNRLRQILSNLIGNAVKFTLEGEVSVRVRQTPDDLHPTSILLQFSVEDSGIGIDPEKQQQVFDIFTQADSSVTREYGGSGLGLTICKRLVEAMNGRIWVESIPGHGSTFHFTVRTGIASAACTVVSEPQCCVGARILVIDDNSASRRVLARMLQGWGALVTEAANGATGLEAIARARYRDKPFQLILLDGRMPNVNGYDVARDIGEFHGMLGRTVLMLNADETITFGRRAGKIGVAATLVKPVRRRHLRQVVDEILNAVVNCPTPPGQAETHDTSAADCSLQILLVEDNPDNQTLFSFYLSKTSYMIDVAENGEVGVKKAVNGRYDIIFMDVEMPIMDGYKATRKIREVEAKRHQPPVPIVALTAHAIKGQEQKSRDAGCTAHMTKPFKKARLLETIERLSSVEP